MKCKYFCEETAAGWPGCIVGGSANPNGCPYTAKQFHRWLVDNDFVIAKVKPIKIDI